MYSCKQFLRDGSFFYLEDCVRKYFLCAFYFERVSGRVLFDGV